MSKLLNTHKPIKILLIQGNELMTVNILKMDNYFKLVELKLEINLTKYIFPLIISCFLLLYSSFDTFQHLKQTLKIS